MKKVLGIALALVLSLALTIPAMAEDGSSKEAETRAEVSGGGGSPPVVKCKWETSGVEPDSESGDPSHMTPGTQVDPMIDEDAQTCNATVCYWAFVTDPQGVQNIAEVAVDVFEPNGEETYKWKYKVVLEQIHCDNKTAMKDAVTAADAAGLVTYDPDFDLQDLVGDNQQIDQGKVKLYRGCAIIEGHQPGGIYHVEAYAHDEQQDMSEKLENCFEYVRAEALVKDFSTIDWGEVAKCSEAVVCGDTDMGTADHPTLKATGNCALDIAVHFSKMYRVEDERLMDEVEFDAYLVGDENRVGGILPCVETDISHPDDGHVYCPVCTPTKLGLSIHVIQAQPGTYTGTVTLIGTDNGLPWGGTDCGNAECARDHTL
jgi:hypothetical protein